MFKKVHSFFFACLCGFLMLNLKVCDFYLLSLWVCDRESYVVVGC